MGVAVGKGEQLLVGCVGYLVLRGNMRNNWIKVDKEKKRMKDV